MSDAALPVTGRLGSSCTGCGLMVAPIRTQLLRLDYMCLCAGMLLPMDGSLQNGVSGLELQARYTASCLMLRLRQSTMCSPRLSGHCTSAR